MKRMLALCFALLLLLPLAACGRANKPEGTVAAFFDAMQKMDLEAMNACCDAAVQFNWNPGSAKEDDETTRAFLEIFRSLAAQMTYAIGDTTRDEDVATVAVTVDYADASFAVKDAMTDAMAKMVTSLFGGEAEESANDMLIRELTEKLRNETLPRQTMELLLSLHKTEAGWRISELPEDLLTPMTGNTLSMLDEAVRALSGVEDAQVEQ